MQRRNIPINPFGQEQVLYDNPEFPSIVYNTLIVANSVGYIPLHWHDEWQMQIVEAGSVEMHVQGDVHTIEAGQGLWIHSGVVHEAYALTDDARYRCWNIQPDLLPRFLRQCFEQRGPKHGYVLLTDDGWQQECLAIIAHAMASDDEFTIYDDFVKVAHLLCTHAEKGVTKPAFDERLKELLVYIHIHYTEKLTLDELAGVVYLSTSETIRLFKKSLQMTPFQYILKYRLEKSRELLQHTDEAVTDIALEIGFSSASYFIQKFKEAYDITPKQFQML
ncbi:AraC family transcriptional regulator [Kurthia populi]|uniref:AraC family transcriptional regulator n=1 Tax=Kurthia populi TaxID=1562132 RepID=A0ABW5Y675_9BACL|nr:AraC family transcriptional regulator [Candidatus Kurthia intestinigallinarum]